MDERLRAAEALESIQHHQDRARRAARLPWWVYAAMFLLVAGVSAANDAVDLSGARLIAVLVLVGLVGVLVITFGTGSAPLSRLRGVQRQQSFAPRAFAVIAVLGGLLGWLLARYGGNLTGDLAGAVGLAGYPNTVAGIVYGAVFTALFALSQRLTAPR